MSVPSSFGTTFGSCEEAMTADECTAVLNAAAGGVVLADRSGIIQMFNHAAERLFGFTAGEVLGRNVTVLMNEQDAELHEQHLARYLETHVPKVIGRGREVTARRKDGTSFPAFLSVGVVENCAPVRFVGFIQDLSVRREAEEVGRRLRERLWLVSRFGTLGEMASGIAHELNQPLAAIATYSQACDRLLAKPDPDVPKIRDALREITGQAVRAGEIIRRLRTLVRRPNREFRPTNINRLISELTDLVQSSTKAHGVDYQVRLGEDVPDLKVQPDEIQQVILNLVRNAIESFPQGDKRARHISIRTIATEDGDVEIWVCDNGAGIPADIAPSLFEPFCSSKDNGTGLGLAMSRTIALRHGGTLTYQPNRPRGACFTLRLPPRTS